MHPFKKNNLILLSAGVLLLMGYYTIFGCFFPNKNGHMGHDYAYYIPALLDGSFWYHTNGLWEIPWFTPSFCGGWVNYINIQNGFYTVPQFFTFFSDPLSSVRFTFLFFAGVGFLGFYQLLRRAFHASQPVSFLGASLFLFNGFYAHRMLVGHLHFHSFMLVPFIALVLLRPLPEEKNARLWRLIFDLVAAGFLLAYMVQSGLSSLLPPAIISIVVIGLIHGLLYDGKRDFWVRFAGAGFSGVLLCSSKLMATFFLLKSFPRSLYNLPGAKSFPGALWLVLKSLFISPAIDPGRMEMLTNTQWLVDRHEWEYSVTIIPVAIMLYGGWKLLSRKKKGGCSLGLSWPVWLHAGAIAAFLILPVALNTYSPTWNAFLKQLPLIKSASSLIRWFIIYIPVVVLITALTVEKTPVLRKYQLSVVIVSVIAVVALNGLANREFYHRQNYDPTDVVKAYREVKSGLWTPRIKDISVYTNRSGEWIMPGFRNNMLIMGASQMLCYEPMFGYRLEAFPVKTLHPGPALEEKDRLLNIKNPACYVWPDANTCEPGDHFSVNQAADARDFVSYRPFHFQLTTAQKAANWANGIMLIAILFFWIAYTSRAAIIFLRR